MWPTALKYQQCPKVKIPRSRFEIHSLGLDSLKVILQTLSKLHLQSTKNSHKCVLNLKLHWITNSTYHSRSVPTGLQLTIPVRCLPFPATIPSNQSHQKFSTVILDYISTILRLSTINRRVGFIKNSSRKKKKKTLTHIHTHTESWTEDLLLSNFQVPFLTVVSHYGLIIFNT